MTISILGITIAISVHISRALGPDPDTDLPEPRADRIEALVAEAHLKAHRFRNLY